jgi:hypothetical protein
VKDPLLLLRLLPCPLCGSAASLLQETSGFSNSHSIRPEGEARHHSNAVFFTSFWRASENSVKRNSTSEKAPFTHSSR